MTSLAKLKERGLVESFDVYKVYVDEGGVVVGAMYNAPKGWCGVRTEQAVLFYDNSIRVRCVRIHYGAWIISQEDWPLLQAAVDAKTPLT